MFYFWRIAKHLSGLVHGTVCQSGSGLLGQKGWELLTLTVQIVSSSSTETQMSSVWNKNKGINPAIPILLEGDRHGRVNSTFKDLMCEHKWWSNTFRVWWKYVCIILPPGGQGVHNRGSNPMFMFMNDILIYFDEER